MIGQRIRARRTELGLSLRALAQEADLTASFLSQIERGQADPSIKSLRRIAEALEVPMLHFLAENGEADPVVRRNRRKLLRMPESQVTYELLTPSVNRRMEMFVARIQPSDESIVHRLPYPTEECILVQEGKITVTLNQREYVLEAGDSIYFDSASMRSLSAVGGTPAVVVWSVTPPVF
jgi:transcriptional regulator with XRE-family HTH domain